MRIKFLKEMRACERLTYLGKAFDVSCVELSDVLVCG